jgi:hypothetical protein
MGGRALARCGPSSQLVSGWYGPGKGTWTAPDNGVSVGALERTRARCWSDFSEGIAGSPLARPARHAQNAAMRVPRRSATRAIAMLALLAAAAAAPASCSSSSALPDGYVAGPVSDVPACCESGDYLALPAVDCPGSSCDGGVAYAVCSDGTFAGCTCALPAEGKVAGAALCDGAALLDAPGFGMDAGCFLDSGEAVPCRSERRAGAVYTSGFER